MKRLQKIIEEGLQENARKLEEELKDFLDENKLKLTADIYYELGASKLQIAFDIICIDDKKITVNFDIDETLFAFRSITISLNILEEIIAYLNNKKNTELEDYDNFEDFIRSFGVKNLLIIDETLDKIIH